jgi:REP-associated tyrosine transposase
MSEGWLGRIPGGMSSVGLHVVWCLKYRWRILGGRVSARCGELVEQASVGYVSESTVRRCVEHRWGAVMAW